MDQGKSLSKNLLYTPLEAYLQNDATTTNASTSSASTSEDPKHPSQYMKNLKSSVPKSIHESSLPIFLHSVSLDYHRNRATVHDAKNNGSRPMSLDDVESRIRQRAVTLLGGGINASLPISSSSSSKRNFQRKLKKRRKRSWKQVEEACKMAKLVKPEDQLDEAEFLRQMNQKWNAYMWKILGLSMNGGAASSSIDEEKMQDRLAVQASNLGRFEKVGAHVRIESCRQHKAWIGRCGVVVSETLRTYHIAVVASPKKEPNEEEGRAVDDPESIETLVVPKQGTCLVLLLPLPPCDPSSGEQDDVPSSDARSETLIPLAAKTICLTIKAGR